MNNKIIVVLYSEAKRKYFSTEEHYKTELEVFPRSKVVKKEIEKLGYKVILLPGNANSLIKLKKIKPLLVFNLVDSVFGKEELIQIIPATLDLFTIPYTGTDAIGLSINSSKFLTKAILNQSGIPQPKFQLFTNKNIRLDNSLKFPLIVKLNESHGSLEINQDSVVESENKLRNRVGFLIDKYHQSVIIEEYIRGKEITVLMIEDKEESIILAEERIFFKKEKYPLYSYEAAWGEKEIYDCISYKLNEKIKEDVRKAFKILQFKDYARFELIIDKNGNHFFIDPNANPSFGPYGTTSGPFGYLLFLNKIRFVSIVKKIINNVSRRFK
ncbi:ATP-grasp domain-containing protein [Candidatus Roizmanbacteria bacterium]|nr:ATP-grasp domain-containing protein [Candidatus Roizmanbacteria bacterium]